jgi:hypothetical protein
MKIITFNFQYPAKTSVLLTGFVFFMVAVYCCHTVKPQFYVSQYVFNYEGEKYRIRTIHSGDREISYNELIGKKFVAADFDQDRIIDQVIMGETNLSEAQEIYEYSLTMLTKENKLQETTPDIKQYFQQNTLFDYEIKSFRPQNSDPFNEFKIIDKHSTFPDISIYSDLQADGTLDNTLKGTNLTPEIQAKYADILATGLQNNKLVKINGTILVKEK